MCINCWVMFALILLTRTVFYYRLIFTRTWLRYVTYVRVFAIANPSVVCLSVVCLFPPASVYFRLHSPRSVSLPSPSIPAELPFHPHPSPRKFLFQFHPKQSTDSTDIKICKCNQSAIKCRCVRWNIIHNGPILTKFMPTCLRVPFLKTVYY